MSKRKGVSAEEKRAMVLQIFHETQDFFQLKEIEKIASKDKRINVKYVKDIVQNLVDDGLVDSDKIGTITLYWSYSSKILNNKKMMLKDIIIKTDETAKELKQVKEKLADAKMSQGDDEKKLTISKEIESLAEIEADLMTKLKNYRNNDPERLQKMKADTKIFIEAANRWTDNIFSIKNWCRQKFMIEDNILDKQFNIPADLDYISFQAL